MITNISLATYGEAQSQLPQGAKWSCCFGNPGEGGYAEYWRDQEGATWIIANGPWHLHPSEFNWHCAKREG
jgi:hypothetical protein